MTDDMALVREFAASRSEEAFATLVSRYLNLVHSAAYRQVGDAHLVQEITQAVFIILSRKAASLGPKTVLSGWLYRTTRFVASDALKARRRRQHREQEAYMQSTLDDAQTDAAWEQLSPVLDDAMEHLGQADRDALVIRFFEGRSLSEVGAALGTSEDAAKKRVGRAVEKLRKFFTKRGITVSTVLLVGAVSANSVQAAPVGLALSITAGTVKGAAVSGSTLTLIKGALKIMAWTKAKTAAVAGVALLLTAGTATVAVKAIHAFRVQPNIAGAWEGAIPTQVGKLRVVVKLANNNGVYRATMDSIDQRVKDLRINKVTYDAPVIRLESDLIKGVYEAKLNATATEMSGTWTQPTLDAPLVLKRTATPTPIPGLLAARDYAPRGGSDVQGYWEGKLQVGTGSLTIGFKISESLDGTLRAEMDSPDQGAKSLVVSAVTYDRPTLRLEVGSLSGVFEGEFHANRSELAGTWTQAGQPMPLVVTRADPNALRAQKSLAAAKRDYSHDGEGDLRGHWMGALDIQGIKLRLALHVGKLPDGALSASLDSIDQKANDLPVQVVQFTAPTVHLELQTIRAIYDGTLENGKITGTWKQGGQSYPLVFGRSNQ